MGFKSKWSIRGGLLAAASMAVISPARAIAAYAYTITELAPPGQNDTEATAINASGQVIINTDDVGPGTHPTYYNGTYHALSSVASNGDTLRSISSSGVAVGYSYNSIGNSVATFVNTGSSSTLSLLTPLSSGAQSAAYAVNTVGTIVGDSTSGGVPKAVTWSGTSASPSLISLPSGSWDNTGSSIAQGVNATGTIVGQATATNGNTDAFVDVSGTISDISPSTGVTSVVEAINSAGSVVGNSVDADGNALAFLYTPGSGPVLLPTLGGTIDESDAESINASGLAVGQSDAADDSGLHAVLYTSSSSIVDLNSDIDPTLGWTLTNAESINDAGDIVGVGTLDGVQEAFLLTPNAAVPEPASLGLICASGVLLLRRRRA